MWCRVVKRYSPMGSLREFNEQDRDEKVVIRDGCRPRPLWWAVGVAVGLVHVPAFVTAAETSSVADIIKRPSRALEERQAWFPGAVAPLSAVLKPPVKAASWPTRSFPMPQDQDVGTVRWMDNRHLILNSQGARSDKQAERPRQLYVVDTLTGAFQAYKPGQLICYWQGRIIYETGPYLSFSRPDVPGARYWSGVIGEETAHPVWTEPRDGRRPYRLVYAEDTCEGAKDPLVLRADDMRLGGAFKEKEGGPEKPVWKRTGLLPQHGVLANHLPSLSSLQFGEPLNAYSKVEWFRPDGKQVTLPLSWRFEIGQAGLQEWAPWLGYYLFSGAGVLYSTAPGATTSSQTPSSIRYGMAGNAVFFNPATGDIVKVPRPASLLGIVQIKKAWATRAGVLWQSAGTRPWGLYLAQGDQVSRISERHVVQMSVSPDGCQAAVTSFDSASSPVRTNRLEIIQFCTGSIKP